VSQLSTLVQRAQQHQLVMLEEVLAELTKYGAPRIGQYSSGWCCSVEMRVSSQGVDFKITSGFDNSTPLQAAIACAERVEATLKDIGLGDAQLPQS
jgi:hypothetical protein